MKYDTIYYLKEVTIYVHKNVIATFYEVQNKSSKISFTLQLKLINALLMIF